MTGIAFDRKDSGKIHGRMTRETERWYYMICIQTIYFLVVMGIVKISEQMHENLRLSSGALNRSINAQAEHWLRVGMLVELNPDLRYGEICRLLICAGQPKALAEKRIAADARAEAA